LSHDLGATYNGAFSAGGASFPSQEKVMESAEKMICDHATGLKDELEAPPKVRQI
jgi:hypothetical protein